MRRHPATCRTRRAVDPRVVDAPDDGLDDAVRRNRFFMGMGGMGGGGGGVLQVLLTELSGLKKPRGFINRHVRRMLGMQPEAAAEVPACS